MIFYVFRKRTPELSQTQIKINSPGQNSIFDIDFPLTLLFNPQLRQGFNPVTGYKALQFLKAMSPRPWRTPFTVNATFQLNRKLPLKNAMLITRDRI